MAWGVSGLPSPASPLYGQARKSLSVLGLGLDFFLILFVRMFVFGMVMVAGKRCGDGSFSHPGEVVALTTDKKSR